MTRGPSRSGGRKKIGSIHSPDSLTALYTTGRQGESKEISGRWSRGAPDGGTRREGQRGAEPIWGRRQTRACAAGRRVLQHKAASPPPLWHEARADVRAPAWSTSAHPKWLQDREGTGGMSESGTKRGQRRRRGAGIGGKEWEERGCTEPVRTSAASARARLYSRA
jgi:hypothetical protein